jgi:GntR family transcriptional regulator
MTMTGIDRKDARPLHLQIRSILQDQILDHSLAPGQQLPTEDELQQQFGVSRSVIRQAMGGLVTSGLIHRQRGRGTVVAASPALRRHIQRAGGLGEEIAARGQNLRTKVLTMEPALPPEPARLALGTSRTWKIERIRYLDDTPVVYMRTWVSRELFPHFTADLLEDASLLALMREHGYPPAGGPRQVQAVAADKSLAEALHVATGSPLLLLQGVTQDSASQGLEWFCVWHQASTVFDVDAQVASDTPALPAEQVQHMRDLVRELDATLATIKSNPN